jgi:acylphosphatase
MENEADNNNLLYVYQFMLCMQCRLHAVISGTVQGVFFRASTRIRARELGIYGYVRNLPSGSVEVVAEGEKEPLDQMASWLSLGPPDAQVDDIKIKWEKPRGEYDSFNVI